MRLLKLKFDLIVTLFKVSKSGGAKALVAGNMPLRQQLVLVSRKLNRSLPRAFCAGLAAFLDQTMPTEQDCHSLLVQAN